jgi:hypothetical protein
MKLACKVVSQVLNFLMSYPELSITFKNHSSWFDWGLDNAWFKSRNMDLRIIRLVNADTYVIQICL